MLALTEDADPGTRAATIDTLGYYAEKNETARKIREYPDLIVGIKNAHFDGQGFISVDRAVEAGRLSNRPVMLDNNILSWTGRDTRTKLLEALAARADDVVRDDVGPAGAAPQHLEAGAPAATMPASRAIAAAGRPDDFHSRTASTLNSVVNCCRFAIGHLPGAIVPFLRCPRKWG